MNNQNINKNNQLTVVKVTTTKGGFTMKLETIKNKVTKTANVVGKKAVKVAKVVGKEAIKVATTFITIAWISFLIRLFIVAVTTGSPAAIFMLALLLVVFSI